MHNSKRKDTVFLVFIGLAGLNGEQVTICNEVNRRSFFAKRDYFKTEQKYYYEGHETLVWARFVSDVFEAPSEEMGLSFVVAWFDGRFTRKSLYDLMDSAQ